MPILEHSKCQSQIRMLCRHGTQYYFPHLSYFQKPLMCQCQHTTPCLLQISIARPPALYRRRKCNQSAQIKVACFQEEDHITRQVLLANPINTNKTAVTIARIFSSATMNLFLAKQKMNLLNLWFVLPRACSSCLFYYGSLHPKMHMAKTKNKHKLFCPACHVLGNRYHPYFPYKNL